MLSMEQRSELVAVLHEKSRPERAYAQEILDFQTLADEKVLSMNAGGHDFKLYCYSAKEKDENAPLFINVHGGAWRLGYKINDSCFGAWLAHQIRGVVLSVDYTTIEEACVLTQLEQCREVVSYAKAHCRELGCDPQRISMGGYSSGGHVTASVGLELISRGEQCLALQIMCYAPFDFRTKPADPNLPQEQAMMRKKRTAASKALMTDDDESLWNTRLLTPSIAEPCLLAQSPETLIITAGQCGFRFEGEAYAMHLAELGVETTLIRFPFAAHGFIPHFGPGWEQAGKIMAKHIRGARLETNA